MSLRVSIILGNREYPAEMQQYAAFHLGIHVCQSTRFGVSKLQIRKILQYTVVRTYGITFRLNLYLFSYYGYASYDGPGESAV